MCIYINVGKNKLQEILEDTEKGKRSIEKQELKNKFERKGKLKTVKEKFCWVYNSK